MHNDHENIKTIEDVCYSLDNISDQIADAHETLKEIKIALYVLVIIASSLVAYAYQAGWFS